MIKMTRVYGDMYAPREYCTFTNPVTSGGTEEVDYVDMPCENGCEKECENCTLQKFCIFQRSFHLPSPLSLSGSLASFHGVHLLSLHDVDPLFQT